MTTTSAPPAYLAQDLWMALGLPVDQFAGYYERNGWAETWAVLLSAVRGPEICGEPAGFGELCVLAPHSVGPHIGRSDVGRSEPPIRWTFVDKPPTDDPWDTLHCPACGQQIERWKQIDSEWTFEPCGHQFQEMKFLIKKGT